MPGAVDETTRILVTPLQRAILKALYDLTGHVKLSELEKAVPGIRREVLDRLIRRQWAKAVNNAYAPTAYHLTEYGVEILRIVPRALYIDRSKSR